MVDAVVGPERLSKLDVVIAGDDVTEKKPHPMIYNTARERIGGIPAEKYAPEVLQYASSSLLYVRPDYAHKLLSTCIREDCYLVVIVVVVV